VRLRCRGWMWGRSRLRPTARRRRFLS
jgi:hypothetical protein